MFLTTNNFNLLACIKVPQMALECTSEYLKSQNFPKFRPTLTDQRGPSCTICPGPPEPSWRPWLESAMAEYEVYNKYAYLLLATGVMMTRNLWGWYQ